MIRIEFRAILENSGVRMFIHVLELAFLLIQYFMFVISKFSGETHCERTVLLASSLFTCTTDPCTKIVGSSSNILEHI